ncbi:hypothetical protein [Burkholderia stagnalis]|uniref:Uncharacterized protein n=1 Tax=Burkholderia stagnalis TaxID=1503054 RepID=A0ABX9YTN7_9BURK|nr:hypothetical protein [Burkholderia stagnalis]MBR7961228.1 hypothetical protein [Burkholderia vietnamiensis]RQQ64378.1 hypothetical protein DF158_06120 [Burkholderia stagnalis]RQQ99997.1 hypothetical protein DF025_36680 [Burkholderia stagnalis]RQR15257.1 hypothetical protein DF021_06120 [Burkholderia stagnalis]RQR25151.1 hypothetical protein DF026_00015 [Burkholderia stagnalis]
MAAIQRPKGGPLAKLAGLWANEPAFLEWMNATGQPANTPDDAAEFIRARCGVESRAYLDHDPRAKARFERYFRGPYSKYRAASGAK